MTKRDLSLNRKYDESDHPFTPAGVTVLPLRLACAEPRFQFTVRGRQAYASASAGAFCGAVCQSFRRKRSTRSVLPCIPEGIWRRTTSSCQPPVDSRGHAADATAGHDRQPCARFLLSDERSMAAQPLLGTPWKRLAVRSLRWSTRCTPPLWLSVAGYARRNPPAHGVPTITPVNIDVSPYHELLTTRWVECSW